MSTTLSCAVPECTTVLVVEEAVSPVAKYVCRYHLKSEQKKALHFQEFAFDPKLNPGNEDTLPEEYDKDWGMGGEQMQPGEKCRHSVYDPTEDQRYCSICNPVKITTVVSEVKKTKIGKIGILKNPTDLEDQAIGLLLFYHTLPEASQPPWFKDRDLHFKSSAKAAFTQRLRGNESYLRDQFVEDTEWAKYTTSYEGL
jgi:hypothetical protein